MKKINRSILFALVIAGAARDSHGKIWAASKAGVARQMENGWKIYEGKDGLPWNDFTCVAAGPAGEMWFGTRFGAIYWNGSASQKTFEPPFRSQIFSNM